MCLWLSHWRKKSDPEFDPDPLVSGYADQIRTKKSRILNTGCTNVNAYVQLSLTFLLNTQLLQIISRHLSSSTQFLFVVEKNTSSHLLFDIMSGTFISGKISPEKSCRSYGPLPNLEVLTVCSEMLLAIALFARMMWMILDRIQIRIGFDTEWGIMIQKIGRRIPIRIRISTMWICKSLVSSMLRVGIKSIFSKKCTVRIYSWELGNWRRYLKAPLGQSKQASLQTITANAEKSRLEESMDTEDKVGEHNFIIHFSYLRVQSKRK